MHYDVCTVLVLYQILGDNYMFTLKNDEYRKARGGKAFLIELSCANCNAHVLTYQKDGDGQLKRCYLNRIMEPDALEKLQYSAAEPSDVEPLKCPSCEVVIGAPIRHHDGRIAFRLRRGFFAKKRIKNE